MAGRREVPGGGWDGICKLAIIVVLGAVINNGLVANEVMGSITEVFHKGLQL